MQDRRACLSQLLCLFAIGSIANAAQKDRDWQTGKVLDAARSRYLAGTIGSANTNGQVYGSSGAYSANSSGSQHAIYRTEETVLIEGSTYAYFAEERHRSRWKKTASLTVNAPVKYAVEKQKLFVLDDEGKEHEMGIVKKVLRQTTP